MVKNVSKKKLLPSINRKMRIIGETILDSKPAVEDTLTTPGGGKLSKYMNVNFKQK